MNSLVEGMGISKKLYLQLFHDMKKHYWTNPVFHEYCYITIIENDPNFVKTEDSAIVFLKWTDFSKSCYNY